VAIDDKDGIGGIKVLPQGFHLGIVAVFTAGTEQWMVPKG
jgi:hypothetical protein